MKISPRLIAEIMAFALSTASSGAGITVVEAAWAQLRGQKRQSRRDPDKPPGESLYDPCYEWRPGTTADKDVAIVTNPSSRPHAPPSSSQ